MSKEYSQTAIKMAIRDYWQQIWQDKGNSIPAFVLSGAGVILMTYLPPLIVAAIITRFGNDSPSLDVALPYIGLFVLVWFAGEMVWRLAIFFLIRNEAKASQNLYEYAMSALLDKDIGFFHNNFAGSLTKKIVGYGKNYVLFMDSLTFNVFSNVIPLFFATYILWRFSPWLAFVLLAMIALILVVLIPLIKRRQKLVRVREESSNNMAGHISDVIGNIDAVQAFAGESKEKSKHHELVEDFTKKSKKSWDYHNTRIDMFISPFYVIVNALGLAIAIAISDDAKTIAVIFVTFNYYMFLTEVVWGFNRIYKNLETSITEGAQFTELLTDDPDIKRVSNPKKLNVKKGLIEFSNVHFKYNDGNDTLFDSLNLSVKPGEKIALVGHSGSGKTTITKLLLRFKELNEGKILIDEQDISECSLESLRKNIAYVPQDPIMFHRTIADNIGYGKLSATEEEVIKAGLQSNAHEFIETLPKGYDTFVGERGVKLSGGQRQRIAIARAMIKDAPILLLDEATSALDSISEGLIQEALWELMEGRTAIVIAHRLSTIQKMDRIIVIDNGKIIEDGSHKQLLEKNGEYAKLWKHQSGGFIKD